jgi:CheY-like chemotaxis protein
VRDTGIGVAPEDVELIFQEFGQVAHRLQSRVKGTGLGLPLSRKLAELLGGQITVQSMPGAGSTFTVTIPRKHGSAETTEEVVDWTVGPGKVPVLLVEDDPADAHNVDRLLSTSVYQPLLARSVREATQILQSVTPAAILLDIILAGDESWRLLLQVRSAEPEVDIPLVVTSSTGDVRKALHLGADEYLAKPLDGERLIDVLDRLTGRRSLTKVLLVDDEEATHYLVRQLLPRGRYSLSISPNGKDGFDRLIEQKPDIVLLDLRMPGMDGFTFLDRMSASAATADVPAVVLTSASLSAADLKQLERAACVMSKSDLSSNELIEAITKARRDSEPAGMA